jgi:hypothetical protein
LFSVCSHVPLLDVHQLLMLSARTLTFRNRKCSP